MDFVNCHFCTITLGYRDRALSWKLDYFFVRLADMGSTTLKGNNKIASDYMLLYPDVSNVDIVIEEENVAYHRLLNVPYLVP